MSQEENVVYLEDVASTNVSVMEENSTLDTTRKTTASKTSTPGATEASSSSTKGTLKRQRTLMEMMSGGTKTPESGSTIQKSAKKQKTSSKSGPSSDGNEAGSSTGAATFGLQPLNSIPFSKVAFMESLSEEVRGLLELECETMGLSWWVRFRIPSSCEIRLGFFQDEVAQGRDQEILFHQPQEIPLERRRSRTSRKTYGIEGLPCPYASFQIMVLISTSVHSCIFEQRTTYTLGPTLH